MKDPFEDWPGFTILDLRIDEDNKDVPNDFKVWRKKHESEIIDTFRKLRKISNASKRFTDDDWEILDSALSTMSLHAQGMDLIDINELQTGKLPYLRELLQSMGGTQ